MRRVAAIQSQSHPLPGPVCGLTPMPGSTMGIASLRAPSGQPAAGYLRFFSTVHACLPALSFLESRSRRAPRLRVGLRRPRV